ncbi:MAG: hypothetical protein J6B25_06890 [Clostridia bacterium]|nr:hypothetical protein [Clostridia bacterium]
MKRTVALILSVLMIALTFCACGTNENKNLAEVRLGLVDNNLPYDEIFYGVDLHLPEHGYKLVYEFFDSADKAEQALVNGDVDFTCVTESGDFELNGNTELVNLGAAYYFPYALFLISCEEEEEIKDGASIAIPSDPDGMARALLLLDYNGYITLKEGADLTATPDDIEKSDRGFKVQPVDPDKVIGSDADMIITDSVRAVDAGYDFLIDSIFIEEMDSIAAEKHSTVILTTSANAAGEKMKLVDEFLFTRRMFNSIDGCSGNMVVPAFIPR